MLYRGFTYSVAEIPSASRIWRWTVKLSATLQRAGLSPNRKQAEDTAVKTINRAITIKQQLARRRGDSSRLELRF